jgi:SAM-dependent methyltransferase
MEKVGDDIVTGSLRCPLCGSEYPVEEGIASLLPRPGPDDAGTVSPYEGPSFLSSYLWSHYGDTFGDRDASAAYEEWAKLLHHQPGFSLDAGCAVGRFTFEMSSKSDFAVGMDNSLAFVRQARELMKNRRIAFSVPEEGALVEEQAIDLYGLWNGDNVEFIRGDAVSLPFRSGCFASLASLNLIDKIPLPLQHLKEMNRTADDRDAQFLISDPFSWSVDIAREENWLGGTGTGAFSGRGIDNVRSLLTGDAGHLTPSWEVDDEGHVWWKIRNHRNHFELIRSCYIKASR